AYDLQVDLYCTELSRTYRSVLCIASRLSDRSQVVRLDFQRDIYQVVVVVHGVQPGNLDDLPFGEMVSERLESRRRHRSPPCRLFNKRERGAFPDSEVWVRGVFGDRIDLVTSHMGADRHRLSDIDTATAAVDPRNEAGEQKMQLPVQAHAGRFVFLNLIEQFHHLWRARKQHLHRRHDLSELPARSPEGNTHHEALRLVDWFESHLVRPLLAGRAP